MDFAQTGHWQEYEQSITLMVTYPGAGLAAMRARTCSMATRAASSESARQGFQYSPVGMGRLPSLPIG